jgi:type I restriction enzyme, S subunit
MELVTNKYKQTDIGLIPSDWEVKELGDVLTFGSGRDYKHLKNGEIPVWGTGGVMTYVDAFLYDGESVGIGRKGTIDKPVYLNGKFWTVDTLFYTHEFIDSNPKFIYYKFCLIKWKEFNEASGVPSLNKNTLQKIKIPVPTLTEQTAIATALSDADAFISSLEKLIAKKRNIKQGAMQKLLQPKEGWEVKKLGSIGKPYGGLSGKSKIDFADGKFPYIPFMNIMSNPIIDTSYVDYVNIGVDESQNKALKGDLFFNGSSETPEEVGMCSVLLEDIPNLYLNSFCFGFRLNKDSKENGLYLSYYFRSSEGRKLFYSMAQGATRYNLSKSNFNKMEVSLSKPEEQIEIANILTDMNNEINALETKLEKYQKIKLGMMQNLLTGKIRLV